MDEREWLAARFEENREHLRKVAYRMLGSLSEADDAVQETWLRLNRARAGDIDNLAGWLTTVAARVCLDMLRSRASRREEPLPEQVSALIGGREGGADPEGEALMADSVGVALLVILDKLTPAERLAFVLHDMFDVSFEEIGSVVGRSAVAARQLASRARRRVRGAPAPSNALRADQRQLVDAFLAALRGGDFEGLVAVLDPNVVFRVDEAAARPGAPREVRGARNWARGALAFSALARYTRPALINGDPGLVVARGGRLLRALRFTIAGGKIVEGEVVAAAARLRALEVAILPG